MWILVELVRTRWCGLYPVIKSRPDIQHHITMIHGQIGFIIACIPNMPKKFGSVAGKAPKPIKVKVVG